ncbi:exodeoxyribonuclease VII large subunit [Clostridium sp. DJ247]|uniref:exodeoxyribonuclease VII large subunit n=1 Tax=Clostridium sp. DJ247 TaxID=2726188 RepID=UPI00162553FE|nr:exodeoxyribonuclease VII large subunit [Clostridium sp. DJ247]MBC2580330.1 exodeoxyribonuclease VII large subunit [Clostridium sp. DJ247]
MYIKTLSVSALTNYIKKIIDNDFILSNSSVVGEISNFKLHSSGHIYFSLKDEFSKINCIMFRSAAKVLNFIPENGMKVVLKGRVSVYEKEGSYQFYCSHMEPEGKGELYAAFEKLKSKLHDEGLFDDHRKKLIPKYARKVGIVTSPTGAAIRDIINVATRRNKSIELVIYPALVQGINASKDIIKGIETLNAIDDIDTIILARGGGSIEELWCFNDEKLAYAVYNSKKPIITGVGHEIDYTIVDFVSDRRAPTPSAAAEIAVFNLEELKGKILNYKDSINFYVESIIRNKKNMLDLINNNLEANNPAVKIVNEYRNIDRFREILTFKIVAKIDKKRDKLSKVNALLLAHNPLNILNKGYAIIKDDNRKVISSISKLKNLKNATIVLADGDAKVNVEVIE